VYNNGNGYTAIGVHCFIMGEVCGREGVWLAAYTQRQLKHENAQETIRRYFEWTTTEGALGHSNSIACQKNTRFAPATPHIRVPGPTGKETRCRNTEKASRTPSVAATTSQRGQLDLALHLERLLASI
jgi:hypothetical protein